MDEELLFQDPTQLKMTDREYEIAMAITHLIKAGEKIGIGEETELEGSKEDYSRNNKHIIRYACEVYRVWGALYPDERREFIENTIHELDIERPIKAAIKAGGYTPVSFPVKLDNLFHCLMPKVKTQDKRFWMPLLSYIPELRRSNYV